MKNSYRISLCLVMLAVIFAAFSLPARAGEDWKPVTPEELALKEPKVEKDADAEALFWEIYVADEDAGSTYQTVLRHYVRIKIFNERGREEFSKVDIPFGSISGFGSGINIKDIAARTTKPDGSQIELKREDIFDREIVKGGGLKLKSKSFAMPGIETGAIIEYRWKEIRGGVSLHQRLYFSREIPVESIKYYVKPVPDPHYLMHGQTFNVKNTPFAKDKDGYYSTTVTNVPAVREEPRMPPEFSVRPWMLLYYTEENARLEPQKFWKDYGRKVYNDNKTGLKISNEVKTALAEATGSETDPEKKIEKIFNYCRAKIKNKFDDVAGFTPEQLKKMKENKTPANTLKNGLGDFSDINRLFAAMLNAAGFDARITNLPRRSDTFFDVNFTDDYFMRTENVAVKIGNDWKFYDPSSRYIPFGMLRWEEEGQPVLISDPKEPVWAQTQFSPPEKSMEKRTGKFKLLEDGTLEGEVRIEYTGHIGAYHKEYNDDETPQSREEILKNLVKANVLSTAEFADIRIENVTDPDKPFIYAFKVRVPGYAERTGKRLFLRPNFFERSAKPLFTTASRKYDIYFNYAWTEEDNIRIDFPDGYSLESPDAPPSIKDKNGVGSHETKIYVADDNKSITYQRHFMFGGGSVVLFPTTAYPALKGVFEAYNRADVHQLTLRQGAPAAATTPKGN